MLTTSLLILLSIGVLLALPVEIIFLIQHDKTSRREVLLTCIWGLVKIPLPKRTSRKVEERPVKKSPQSTDRRGRRRVLALMRNADFRQRLLRYVRKLIQSVRIKALDVQVRIGLDDPADTGRLWGVLGPFAALLSSFRQANIRLEPEFASEAFSWRSTGRIRIIPMQVLLVSLSFLLSPQVIRALLLNR